VKLAGRVRGPRLEAEGVRDAGPEPASTAFRNPSPRGERAGRGGSALAVSLRRRTPSPQPSPRGERGDTMPNVDTSWIPAGLDPASTFPLCSRRLEEAGSRIKSGMTSIHVSDALCRQAQPLRVSA
jgi:hypothetical protein